MRDRDQLKYQIRDILDRQAALRDRDGPTVADPRLEFEKWRLIHKYLHDHPFASPSRLARAAQWREAAGRVRALGDVELLDWALSQAEIADHLARGIQDLRPRKNGPCHALLLEYVANRKRKALAVLHFTEAGRRAGVFGVNSDFHARTEEILGTREDAEDATGPGDGGHEAPPWRKPGK